MASNKLKSRLKKIRQSSASPLQSTIRTSASIRLFNQKRLKSAISTLRKLRPDVQASESKLILLCLQKFYQHPWQGKFYQHRARVYNPGLSQYQKVSLYMHHHDYSINFTKALHCRVSISYLCDMALIEYLHEVIEDLLKIKEPDARQLQTLCEADLEEESLVGNYTREVHQNTTNSLVITHNCHIHMKT